VTCQQVKADKQVKACRARNSEVGIPPNLSMVGMGARRHNSDPQHFCRFAFRYAKRALERGSTHIMDPRPWRCCLSSLCGLGCVDLPDGGHAVETACCFLVVREHQSSAVNGAVIDGGKAISMSCFCLPYLMPPDGVSGTCCSTLAKSRSRLRVNGGLQLIARCCSLHEQQDGP
jgi:hypothetical protein